MIEAKQVFLNYYSNAVTNWLEIFENSYLVSFLFVPINQTHFHPLGSLVHFSI